MTTVKKSATDQSFYFKMVDSAAGTPKTGLTITAIDATYVRNRAGAVKNDLTALAAVTTAHTDNQGIEIDATNAPGLYRVDFPDAAFASGVDKVILIVTCAGADPAMKEIELVDNVSADVMTLIGTTGSGLTSLASAASLSVVAGYIDTEIGTILTTLGSAGAGLTAVPWNSAWGANVATSVWNAATATYGSAGSYGLLIETNLDVPVSTVGGGSLTVAAIADGVWDEVLSGHLTAGSTGEALDGAGGGSGGVADWTANEKTAIRAILGIPASGTTPDDPTTGILDTIRDAVITVDDLLDTEMPALTVSVAAIKAKTDNLPLDPADASDVAAAIAVTNGKVDAVQADTDNIQTRLPAALVGGRMDSNLSAIGASTTALTAFQRGVKGNVVGTVGVGSTTTSIVTSAFVPAGSVSTQFKGRIITFMDDTTTAALRGQSTDITASTASATPTLTVTALTTAPASGDTFVIS